MEGEGNQDKLSRQRGGFSRNLWVYLKGLPFGYEEDPPVGSGSAGPSSSSEQVLAHVDVDAAPRGESTEDEDEYEKVD